MAITNFIPEIWAAAVAQALQETATIAPITNTQYEGEARKGNSVHITGVVVPTITDYSAAGRTSTAEDLSDAGAPLPIDQEKSFDFNVDDIDRVQAAGSFDAWTTAAGRALGEDSDAYIAAQAIAGGTDATAALGGATTVVGGVTAHNAVRDLRKILNKAKVPKSERWLLLNSEFEGMFLDADAKITSVDTSGTPAGLREAMIGRYLGFNIVSSEQLPVVDFPQAIAFWRPALAYVSQVDKVESLRSHTKFADRVRGLHVYGSVVPTFYAPAVQFYTGAAA